MCVTGHAANCILDIVYQCLSLVCCVLAEGLALLDQRIECLDSTLLRVGKCAETREKGLLDLPCKRLDFVVDFCLAITFTCWLRVAVMVAILGVISRVVTLEIGR